MGGQAFNQLTADGKSVITTPRLPPEIYARLKQRVMDILNDHFRECICPHEAPDKADHGDIDILVSEDGDKHSITDMALWLGAELTIDRGDSYSFALPYTASDGTVTHAQVDVHPCGDNLRWLAFMQSYGDIWQILGVSIRGFGFTATDRGLHVRLPQVEKKDWKASMIFLGKEPHAVMQFLGLDSDTYTKGFTTEHQIFEWISEARLFSKDAFLDRIETSGDRRRMRSRGMFNRFVNEYIPTLPSSSRNEPHQEREALLAEAIRIFGKEDEYSSKASRAAKQQDEETARDRIHSILRATGMTHDKVNMTIRGFKRWTVYDGTILRIRDAPEMNDDDQIELGHLLAPQGDTLRADMHEWVLSNHEEIKTREKRRTKDAKVARSQQRG